MRPRASADTTAAYRRSTRALTRGPAAPRLPDSAAEAAVCAKIADLVGRRPEAVAFIAWNEASMRCAQARDTGALPPPDVWFRPLVPPGTAYQAATRMTSEAGVRYGLDRIEGLHALAPYDSYVARLYIGRRFAGQASPEEYRAAMGPLVEYDVDVLESWIAAAPGNTAVAAEVASRRYASRSGVVVAPSKADADNAALHGRARDQVAPAVPEGVLGLTPPLMCRKPRL